MKTKLLEYVYQKQAKANLPQEVYQKAIEGKNVPKGLSKSKWRRKSRIRLSKAIEGKFATRETQKYLKYIFSIKVLFFYELRKFIWIYSLNFLNALKPIFLFLTKLQLIHRIALYQAHNAKFSGEGSGEC